MKAKAAAAVLSLTIFSLLVGPQSGLAQNGAPVGHPIIGGMQSNPAQGNAGQQHQQQAGGAEHHTKVNVSEIMGLGTATQHYTHGSHSFSITPTPGCRLQIMQKASGKSFNFLGPMRADSAFSIFSVMILVANQSHPMPSKEALLQKVLLPYKTRMTGYAANPCTINLGGGHQESGIEYSGTFENTKARGFFVVIPVNDCFYVISGSDRYNEYDQARQNFEALEASLDIKS